MGSRHSALGAAPSHVGADRDIASAADGRTRPYTPSHSKPVTPPYRDPAPLHPVSPPRVGPAAPDEPRRQPVRRRLPPVLALLAVLALIALLALLLLALLPDRLPATAPETSVAAPGTRARWVWTAAAPADVVAWARTPGVTTVFAYVDRATPDATRLRDLRRRCDDAGIIPSFVHSKRFQ